MSQPAPSTAITTVVISPSRRRSLANTVYDASLHTQPYPPPTRALLPRPNRRTGRQLGRGLSAGSGSAAAARAEPKPQPQPSGAPASLGSLDSL